MDPAQLADEAVRRFIALRAPGSIGNDSPESSTEGSEPLLELFDQLGALDSWAKIAEARLMADPHDVLAAQDLCRCLDHTARLHPHFIRRLDDVLHERTAAKKSHSVPQQPSVGVTTSR